MERLTRREIDSRPLRVPQGTEMIISVQLFAVAKQLANRATVEVDLPPEATVAELRAALLAQVPSLAGMAGQLRFAVNEEYARDETRIPAGGRVACIPPVSGG